LTTFESPEFEIQLREVSAEFRERLDMLEGAGQITALARWLTEHALAEIARHCAVRLEEANAAQFVTHLAVALTRLQRGEEAEQSAVVADEIADRVRERKIMRRLMDECERLLDREVPEVEVDYMTVHLCALLEGA
jgi:transcriptional regulatory protein LevR